MDISLKILKGILMGLMVSVPLGPVGIIVIQRTLNRGWVSGFCSGLGAATTDLLYAICAATGFGLIIQLVENHTSILEITTFATIAVIGYVISKKSVHKLRKERSKSSNLFTDFLSIFLLTFSNPLVIGVFLAFFTGITTTEETTLESIIFILIGIFIGALGWWITLTASVSLFRHKFHFRNLFWINKVTGLVILAFGIGGLIYTLAKLGLAK